MINKKFVDKCLNMLKSKDVRNEIKIILSPMTDLIVYELYPYIYVIIILVFLIFVLILIMLIILILLLRNNYTISK
jgi:hypothetical protein